MRNIYTILLMMLLTCSVTLVPMTFLGPSGASGNPDPRIYLDPSDNTFYSNTTSVGHRFNVTIWCADIPAPILGAQITLHFNDTVLNVTQWWTPTWDSNFFMPQPPPITTIPTPPNPGYIHVGAGHGYVKVSVSKGGLPPAAPYGHNGTIAIIEFIITSMPPEGGQLTSSLNINNVDTFLKDSSNVNIPGITKEDGSYTIIYVTAPVTPTIWLETSPSTFEARKLRPFNVSIIVKNVSETMNLVGIQFIVSYNSTYLTVEQIIQGDFLSNTTWAHYGTFVASYVDSRGAVYGELILPNGTGQYNPPFPEGDGKVATITFLPLLHKETSFNITITSTPLFGEFFVNKDGEYIPYLPAKGCQYAYNPLPLPTLAITPSTYTASHVGETFDVDVTLNDLDVQWDMTYVEFALWYDINTLQLLDVVEGDFLSQFGDTTFNHTEGAGYTKVNITLTPTAYPYGTGTLATMTFNVTTSPGVSKLLLNDTKLLDFEAKEVLHKVQHGYYQLHEVLIHPIVWDTETFDVITVSNTSVTPVPMLFNQPHMMLYFNVTGYDNTIGFVNITIPKDLLYSSPSDWFVIVKGEKVEVTLVENATHVSLYFTFSLSSTTVYVLGTSVIPEMPPNILMLVLLAASLMGLAVAKKARLNKREELVHCKTP